MGWAFLFAAVPDVDFALLLFTGIFTYLNEHRGYTHSLVMLPVWAALLGAFAAKVSRRSFKSMALLAAVAIAVHIAGDVITSYGTKLFKPLSGTPFAYPITFIIDPVFTGILLVGVIGVYRKRRRWPAVVSGVALVCWLGLQAAMHVKAEDFGRAYAEREKLNDAVVVAFAQPLSPFRWKIVVAENGNYHRSYVDFAADKIPENVPDNAGVLAQLNAAYRPPEAAYWQVYPRWPLNAQMRELARQAWQQQAFAGFRQFALLPYVSKLQSVGNRLCVWSTDLRFTLPGRAHPFEYAMCHDARGGWQLEINNAETLDGGE